MIGAMPLPFSVGEASVGAAPWRRSPAKAIASWQARSAIATPCNATDRRALFIIVNMQASPRFSSPSSQPRAPPPSP